MEKERGERTEQNRRDQRERCSAAKRKEPAFNAGPNERKRRAINGERLSPRRDRIQKRETRNKKQETRSEKQETRNEKREGAHTMYAERRNEKNAVASRGRETPKYMIIKILWIEDCGLWIVDPLRKGCLSYATGTGDDTEGEVYDN